MSLRKVLTLILALCVMLLMVSCNNESEPCTTHTDSDANNICDVCEASIPDDGGECTHTDADGDDICDICDEYLAAPANEGELTLTVKDAAGAAYADVTVKITDDKGSVIASGKTDASGKFTKTLVFGEYNIIFELEADGYIYVPGGQIVHSEDSSSFEYQAIDNTPDGSEEKPFFLGLDEEIYTIPAGTSYTFTIKGETRMLVIENENIKVTYGGEEYLPADGKLEVTIAGTENPNDPPTAFLVTNTASDDQEITLKFVSEPGTRNNPYTATLGEAITTPESVNSESTIYYVWVAEEAGTISLTSSTENNNIMLTNLTKSQVSDFTSGAVGQAISLEVEAGDEIRIEVSARGTGAVVTFELTFTEKAE